MACYNSAFSNTRPVVRPDASGAGGFGVGVPGSPAIVKNPIFAFAGTGGRSHATHAAIVATSDPELGASAIVRVTTPGEPRPGLGGLVQDHVAVVEATAAGPDHAGVDVDLAVSIMLGEGRTVILDMPVTLLADAALRERIAVPVLAVGPTDLEVRLARAALGDPALMTIAERVASTSEMGDTTELPSPPWILGVERSGGWRDAEILAREMRGGDEGRDGPAWPHRVLPLVLPTLSREEVSSLSTGWPLPRADQAAHRLGVALRAAARDPHAAGLTLAEVADGMRAQADGRWTPGRLYDLADDLVGIAAGSRPTPEDLAAAPILEDWAPSVRVVRSVAGRVHGHPGYPAAHAINTSEAYATDGATWVRTYSRWYRLGQPAEAGSAPASVN